MKIMRFWFILHWNLFPMIQVIVSMGPGNGSAPQRCRAINWTNVGQDWWCHLKGVINSSPPSVSLNQVSIGSDNGLSPIRRQAIIWTSAGLLSIRPLGTNFNEILTQIQNFSFMKLHLKMSSAKWRQFCLGLNVLRSVALLIVQHTTDIP